jgi:YfiH family protein
MQSELLASIEGVVHGFTTRHGGLSRGSFESLNLGTRTEDERSVVETNRRKVLAALGRHDGTLITLRQVHGADLVEVSHLAGCSIPADGLWSRDPLAVLGVLVADCVPILIADVAGTRVAAVHAGWRGTRARIAAKMVKRLVDSGAELASLRVAIGPAIGPCCFEIGEDVANDLRAAIPEASSVITEENERRTVADLWALNERVLFGAGLVPSQIDTLRLCSKCDPRFFSHRRDGARTGRQAGVIGLLR